MRNVVLIFLFSAISLMGYAQTSSSEEGLATFYSNKFNGRKTSSGEIYRHTKLTAAHPSLPFGTEVKVTNPDNGKSVIVRINDRCSPRRITIDLSKAAAKKIDLIASGIKKVRIEVASDSIKQAYLTQEMAADSVRSDSITTVTELSTPIDNEHYTIQVASVKGIKNANRLSDKLTSSYSQPSKSKKVVRHRKHLYKVFVGDFATYDEATSLLKQVKDSYPTAFIIPLR